MNTPKADKYGCCLFSEDEAYKYGCCLFSEDEADKYY
jgi:hypothetical protein